MILEPTEARDVGKVREWILIAEWGHQLLDLLIQSYERILGRFCNHHEKLLFKRFSIIRIFIVVCFFS